MLANGLKKVVAKVLEMTLVCGLFEAMHSSLLQDILCDVWWKLGTSDPNNPCYGYWDARDKIHTPVQFFGLSSLGPTTLEYNTYDVGPPNANLTLPNKDCHKECKPPGLVKLINSKHRLLLPHFPSCD